jgi:hypothetical protein
MTAALPPEPYPLRQSHSLNLLVQAIERTACMARRSLANVHIVQLREGFFNQLGINQNCRTKPYYDGCTYFTCCLLCLREKQLGPFYNNKNPMLINAEKQFKAVPRIVIAVNDGGTNIWEGQHWCHQPSCCNLSLSLRLGCCHATTIQSDTPQTFKPSKHQIQS